MSQKPTMKIKYGLGIGVELFVYHPDIQDNPTSYLTADTASGATSVAVIDGSSFSSNDYILIGGYGDKQSEILKISSVSADTLNTSTAVSAHNRGDSVIFIPYNQVVISRSTDSGSVYSALSAINIQPSNDYTYLIRTSDASTDMYKFRFYNSTTTLYSDYSDAVVGAGFADNTVHSIKKRALNQLGDKIDDVITDEFLNESLWEARRNVDNDQEAMKLPFRFKTNANIGSVIPGTYYLSLPTTLKDPYSNKNILSVRFGRDNQVLEYQDITTFNQNYQDVAMTTLNGNVADTDVTITLTDSGDFDDSGNIEVAAATVAGTIDTIAYTANAEATNILSGVTGIATGGHTSGTIVWQGVTFGQPTTYTIDAENKRILFDCPIDNDYAGENVYMDYYSTVPAYDSDADTLDEPNYDIFVSYLKWKIKSKRQNGTLNPTSDVDYLEWVNGKKTFLQTQYAGQDIRLIPDIL